MAKLIPSGVIQLPNFAELQYNLDRQKRADEMSVARELAQYKRQSGAIAPGAMPLVQQEFDAWQNGAKKFAANPSAANFSELNSAYENYSQAHGYGKFLNDTVRERDAQYYSDPTKWNIKVDDYNLESRNILSSPYSSLDELATAASNIPSLRPLKKYSFTSVDGFTKLQKTNWKSTFKDLDTTGAGKVTPEQRLDWFDNVFQHQIDNNPDALLDVVLSEASLASRFGGQPLTTEDIDLIKGDPEVQKKYRDSFYEKSLSDFEAGTSLNYVDEYRLSRDKEQDAKDRAKDGAEKIPKQYSNLTTTPPPSGSGFIYRIDNQPIKTSDGTQIIAFGVVDGVEQVQVIRLKGPLEYEDPIPEFRTATSEDKANMKSETGNAYQMYISKGKPLGSQTPAAGGAPGFMSMPPTSGKDLFGNPL